MHKSDKSPQHAALETFAVIGLFCLLAGLTYGMPSLSWLAAGCLVTGLFLKGPARALSGWWLRFSALLGRINTRVLLGAVFYLVLTPVAFVFRIFHKDPLRCCRSGQSDSYWVRKKARYRPEDMEKLW